MATYTLEGISFDVIVTRDFFGDVSYFVPEVENNTLEIVLSEQGDVYLNQDYELFLGALEVRLDGETIADGAPFVEGWVWQDPYIGAGVGSGAADVALTVTAPESYGADFRVTAFSLTGDPLPDALTGPEISLFYQSLIISEPASSALQPDDTEFWRVIDLGDLHRVDGDNDDLVNANPAGSLIELGKGDDTVDTGGGSDQIFLGRGDDLVLATPEFGQYTFDIIDMGPGQDRIDLSAMSEEDSYYLSLRHSGLDEGFNLSLNVVENTLVATKGDQGETVVENPNVSVNTRGVALYGTEHADEFNVVLADADNWIVVIPDAGNDVIRVSGDEGTVWLLYEETGQTGINADLQTGIVANDGQGGQDQITGKIARLTGTVFDDAIRAKTDQALNYVPYGGDDTFIASADFGDVLNFYRFDASDVVADLATGIATYAYADQAYQVSFSGVEILVGSNIADDQLFGSEDADELWGNRGDDTLVGRDGDDSLYGEDGVDQLWAGRGNDYLSGGNGADTLYGGDGDDTIAAGDEDDLVGAGQGADRLIGAGGNDALWTAGGNDTALGEEGNDTLGGAGGNDSLDGGIGNDALWGGLGFDTLLGGDGQDTLGGAIGDDQLFGGADNDALWGALGNDSAEGGLGDDLIGGGAGRDTLHGDTGNDEIWGGAEDDLLTGGLGQDVIGAGLGDDQIDGGGGDDQLFGGAGADTIFGGIGVDLLVGAEGDDSLAAGGGSDTVFGGAGADTLVGVDGDDSLSGGDGNDQIYGGNGADTLIGGAGDDLLDGGLGDDVFVFAPGQGQDTLITDSFDRIQLTSTLTGGLTDASAVVSTFGGVANGVVVLQFDADQSLTLQGMTSLTGLEAMIDVV